MVSAAIVLCESMHRCELWSPSDAGKGVIIFCFFHVVSHWRKGRHTYSCAIPCECVCVHACVRLSAYSMHVCVYVCSVPSLCGVSMIKKSCVCVCVSAFVHLCECVSCVCVRRHIGDDVTPPIFFGRHIFCSWYDIISPSLSLSSFSLSATLPLPLSFSILLSLLHCVLSYCHWDKGPCIHAQRWTY